MHLKECLLQFPQFFALIKKLMTFTLSRSVSKIKKRKKTPMEHFS